MSDYNYRINNICDDCVGNRPKGTSDTRLRAHMPTISGWVYIFLLLYACGTWKIVGMGDVILDNYHYKYEMPKQGSHDRWMCEQK